MATDIIARGMITEYKSGTNIDFKENEDGSVTISASGDVSSEDTVARDTINNHKLDKNNPHNVTAEQIGLGNVDNTADLDKPISTAIQTALNDKANTKHTHKKSDITDFPNSLPANGGNADTVDGLHADGFIKANGSYAYDCNTLYDAGLYLCNGSATNTPNDLTYGSLLVMPYRKPYGNSVPDYCAQIFIPNGDVDDPSLWYRTSFKNTWNEWKRSCDGGNANTVNGHMVNIDVPADAVFTDTVPDLSPYVKTADVPNIKVNSASNADTVSSLRTNSNYRDIFSTSLGNTHPGWNRKCYAYGRSDDSSLENYIENAPETGLDAVWYEVETIGYHNRAYQIAYGCYNHQRKTFIRYMHDGAWSGWKNIADGGNADTVDGLHADDFYSSGNKPYVTGSVSISYSTESQNFEFLNFTPSAVICRYASRYENDGTIKWATPITNGFKVNVSSTEATSLDYIAFR